MIISVRGIQGSGKSYLCKRLYKSKIKCFDTDDYVSLAYEQLRKKKSFLTALRTPHVSQFNMIPDKAANQVFSLAKKLLEFDLKSCRKPICVVVGITIKVDNPDKIFFIRMSDQVLKTAYKRTLSRELAKLRSKRLQSDIKKLSAAEIGACLVFKYHVNALEIGTPLAGYKQMYKSALQFECKQKAIIMTQAGIIRSINTTQTNDNGN